ncbi:hypothetical protein SAMN04515667_0950 [Formosa sp. Hel1_31_208]|uniref:hypothetical protein n=1 Tax=Formosa sp. Hel1_31_208 TaxID=1798225 RepID=UPI00087C2FE1|nr:hypothetical protein [Formosa sp. Hel1_31_208]SDR90348.1 hypothetical protein SAMN04515667_0950 [Formosa sp. Hel1_31_208]
MKEALKKLNKKFKEQELQRLANEREGLIHALENLKEDYLKINDLQKFVLIAENVFKLSFYKDDEVIEVVKSFGLLKYTPNVFINNTDFFQALDGYQEQVEYLYPYELVWGFYERYSSSVIKEKIALDLKIDLSDVGRKVNRQINNLNFPPILRDVIDDLKKLADLLKTEIPNYKMPLSDTNPLTSVMHIINYAHKNELYNLYHFLIDFNRELNFIDVDEGDFKFEFYALLEILYRTKGQLNNSEKAKANYYNERQFRVAHVNRNILS